MSDARVLCIDDEPELLKIAKQFLEKGGALSVDTVTSATVALEQLKTTQYDTIIADYAMPDMDGIAFLKALKEMGNTTPVIIFTGRGREDVVIEALNNGADFYLQKGGNPQSHFTELSKMIHHAVSRKRAEEALKEAYDNLEIQVNERTIQLADTNRGLLEEIEEREKTEEKLRETEATIRTLMDSPVDSMVVFDPKGVIIDANQTFATRLGRTINELMGTNTYDLFSPALAKSRRAQVEEVLQKKVPIRFEDKRDDMWLDLSIHPIFDAENNVVKIAVVARDITERRKMEEALRASEEKYRLIFEYSPLGNLSFDENGVIIACNDKFVQIIGSSHEDLIGLNMLKLPDKKIVAAVQEALNGGQGFYEGTYNSVTGKKFTPVRGLFAPMIIGGGRIPGGVGIFEDITERKQAEEALRTSEQKYRDIFENSVTGLFKTSHTGQIMYANDALARMYGYNSATEILQSGVNVGQLYANPEDRNEVLTILAENGIVENYEAQQLKRDGTRFWASITARAIRNADGYVLFYEGTNIDITERKRVEEALRIANKKLTLLTSITRHDINNQLTSLRGYLTLLEKNRPDSPKEEYIRKASKAAERIFAMVQFAKGYEQIGVQAPVWQDCRVLVDNAAKEIQAGTIEVKNDIPAGMEVFADPLIAKVFYNLMDNAVRYGETITSIRFLTTKRDKDCILICEDNGVGVQAGYKEKIFEQDFGKNTGLGLFLSREILSITGITITETGIPGKGARFEMTVPDGAWRIPGVEV